jgi:hypothetical protein
MNGDLITRVWAVLPGPGFRLTAVLAGLTLISGAFAIAWLLPRQPDAWRKLPRERRYSVVLALWVMLWAAHLAQPLLEGGLTNLRQLLLPLAMALTVLAFFFLDYLFTRAVAGLTILVATWIMEAAFIAQVPARWLLAVVGYVLATIALYLLASPYRFRDWLDACARLPKWRHLSAGLLALAAIVPLVLALLAHH